MLSAIRKTAPGVEDEPLKGGDEKMDEDGEEKKAEVVAKKELTGEEAELQNKVGQQLVTLLDALGSTVRWQLQVTANSRHQPSADQGSIATSKAAAGH